MIVPCVQGQLRWFGQIGVEELKRPVQSPDLYPYWSPSRSSGPTSVPDLTNGHKSPQTPSKSQVSTNFGLLDFIVCTGAEDILLLLVNAFSYTKFAM